MNAVERRSVRWKTGQKTSARVPLQTEVTNVTEMLRDMEDRIRESQMPLTAESEGKGAEAVLNETTAEKLTKLMQI